VPAPASAYFVRTGAQWATVEQAKKVYVSKPLPPKRLPRAAVVNCAVLLGGSAVVLGFLLRNKAEAGPRQE
jgi:hypothetical protein